MRAWAVCNFQASCFPVCLSGIKHPVFLFVSPGHRVNGLRTMNYHIKLSAWTLNEWTAHYNAAVLTTVVQLKLPCSRLHAFTVLRTATSIMQLASMKNSSWSLFTFVPMNMCFSGQNTNFLTRKHISLYSSCGHQKWAINRHHVLWIPTWPNVGASCTRRRTSGWQLRGNTTWCTTDQYPRPVNLSGPTSKEVLSAVHRQQMGEDCIFNRRYLNMLLFFNIALSISFFQKRSTKIITGRLRAQPSTLVWRTICRNQLRSASSLKLLDWNQKANLHWQRHLSGTWKKISSVYCDRHWQRGSNICRFYPWHSNRWWQHIMQESRVEPQLIVPPKTMLSW